MPRETMSSPDGRFVLRFDRSETYGSHLYADSGNEDYDLKWTLVQLKPRRVIRSFAGWHAVRRDTRTGVRDVRFSDDGTAIVVEGDGASSVISIASLLKASKRHPRSKPARRRR